MTRDRATIAWLVGGVAILAAMVGMMLVVASVVAAGTFTAGVWLLVLASLGFLGAGLLSGNTA